MVFDLRLKNNFKLFLSGPSGCGKTTLMLDMIKNMNKIASHPPQNVVYYFKTWQSKFDTLKNEYGVTFMEDNEDMIEQLKSLQSPTLVIFDDMINSDNLKHIAQLFTVYGRHLDLSLAFLSQRLFNNNEFFRQISQNSDYFCVFKNPRNSMEIRNLAMQITPKTLELLDIFRYATVNPYSYLFINLTQEAIPQLKYISNIFTRAHVIQAFVLTTCK